MSKYELIFIVGFYSLALYAFLTEKGLPRDVLASIVGMFNLAIFVVAGSSLQTTPVWIEFVAAAFVAVSLYVLSIPVLSFCKEAKDKTTIERSPAVSSWLTYTLSGLTFPAMAFAMLNKTEPLLPDLPPPFSYVALAGMAILALVGLLAATGLLKTSQD